MTSNDTNAKTIDLLQKNSYFGMDSDQITIVQQGQGVPALENNDAKIAVQNGRIVTNKQTNSRITKISATSALLSPVHMSFDSHRTLERLTKLLKDK